MPDLWRRPDGQAIGADGHYPPTGGNEIGEGIAIRRPAGPVHGAPERSKPPGAVLRLSRLTAEVLRREEVDVERLLGQLAPARVRAGRHPTPTELATLACIAYATRRPLAEVRADFDFFRSHAHYGKVLRLPSADRGCLGVRLRGRSLHLTLRIGSALMRLAATRGSLVLDQQIPLSVLASAAGRPLEDVFDHPLVAGSGAILRGVAELDEQTSGRDAGVVVLFSLPTLTLSVATSPRPPRRWRMMSAVPPAASSTAD